MTKQTAQKKHFLKLEVFKMIEELDNQEIWFLAVDRLSPRLRKQMLEKKLRVKLQHAFWNDAEKIARMLGRGLTPKEMEIMFERDLSQKGFGGRHGHFVNSLPPKRQAHWHKRYLEKYLSEGEVDKAKNMADKLGRSLTEGECDILLAAQRPNWHHSIYNSITAFPESRRKPKLRQFLNKCLKDGEVDYCITVAKDLGRPLTKPQIIRLIKGRLKGGSTDEAKKAKELLGKPLSHKELEMLLKAQMNQAWFSDALETAKLFPEPRKTRELKKLLKFHIERLELDEAENVVKALGREFTTQEREEMFRLYKAKKSTHHRDSHLCYLAEKMLESIGARVQRPAPYSGPGA